MTDFSPRTYIIKDVELNWARLDTPVSPFGTPQYELQIAVKTKKAAKELTDNNMTVKERDGKFTVSLKRRAIKADGSDNGKVRVVDGALNPITNVKNIGNGSRGNVNVFQYAYDTMGRSGVASSLTAVQITSLEVYEPSTSDFDVIADQAPVDTSNANMF